eukprot:9516585-Alexandrium_andersonii.AAC.1
MLALLSEPPQTKAPTEQPTRDTSNEVTAPAHPTGEQHNTPAQGSHGPTQPHLHPSQLRGSGPGR